MSETIESLHGVIATLERELHKTKMKAIEANIRADRAEKKLKTYKAKVKTAAGPGGWIAVEWQEDPLPSEGGEP